MPDEEKPEPIYRQCYVKATDPNVCGCWEQHPQHPEGEVFVTGTDTFPVACTPIVLDALAKNRIVEVGSPSVQAGPPSEGAPAEPAIGGKHPSDVGEDENAGTRRTARR